MSVRRAQDERLEGTPDGFNAITEISDVPDTPVIGTATAGVESASVTFTAAATGGSVTTFRALSTPGSIAGTSATSPITVSGLTAGTAYTFQVRGENSTGNSAYSSASNSATPTVPPTAFDSIATVTVGSGGGDIEFTSIPGTYQHLQLRGILRTSDSGSFNNQSIRFNGDTASNYGLHRLVGNGSTVTSNATVNIGSINDFMRATGTGITSNVFSAAIIDILDYSNTNKYKTIRVLNGQDANGSGEVILISGLWRSTSAITSIRMYLSGSTGGTQNSTFALYGIKGA